MLRIVATIARTTAAKRCKTLSDYAFKGQLGIHFKAVVAFCLTLMSAALESCIAQNCLRWGDLAAIQEQRVDP